MRRALLAGVLALGSGCGPDNSLSGSLGAVFPLDVSRVEIRQNEQAMQVTYLLNRGVFLDVVARVSISLSATGTSPDGGVPTVVLKPGAHLALEGDAPNGTWRTAVTHAPGGEPVRNLPRVKKGDLNITSGGTPGEVLRGNFSVLFEQEGGDVGFGRTLSGTFAGMSQDAGYGELP